jgi:hypothetical protein
MEGSVSMHLVSGAVLEQWQALSDEQIVAQVQERS